VRVPDLSVPGNLSRVSWKLSRTVLRGGTNSNVGPLLDMRTGKTKQPYCFEVGEGELFAFAGLLGSLERPEWQLGKDMLHPDHDTNAVTAPVHDRMPVILDPDGYEIWLDPGMKDVAAASELTEAPRR
jgi:putative SOS response-associated peptidase YedK